MAERQEVRTGGADAFHESMAGASVSALWERGEMRNARPSQAHIWHWKTMDPLLDEAVRATTTEMAERRVLTLDNPSLAGSGTEGAALNLSVNLQVLMPGEKARPHRHTMNALRFVLESDGAVTIVDGKTCPMARGDMILTPGWTWHEHAHNGAGRTVWVDALDVPIHRFLDTGVFEPGPAHDVPKLPADELFNMAGFAPWPTQSPKPYSPMFRYPWDIAVKALAKAPVAPEGCRKLRYTNPVSGGPAMPPIDCYLVALETGRVTIPYKTTANTVCVVAEGEGTTRAGEETMDWGPNDIFALPHGEWISHAASSKEAILFQITDRDLLERLGHLREEVKS
jgi:gentisate 1,2-dioxygenase